MLGCRTGREAERWIDFDFHGHQISAHVSEDEAAAATNPVDGDRVPVRHFGLILDWPAWDGLAERLRSCGTPFLIEPRVRFQGQAGEQGTFFVVDPSGNALEFKAFRHDDAVFQRDAP